MPPAASMPSTRHALPSHGGTSSPPAAAPARAMSAETPFRSGYDQVDQLFESMRTEIMARQSNLHQLEQALTAMEDKSQLFEKDDIEVTRRVVDTRKHELEVLQQNYSQAQSLSQRNVIHLETMIQERETEIKQIDQAFGAISGEDQLRIHFGQKQAQLKKALNDAKARLCDKIRELFAGATAGPEGHDATSPPRVAVTGQRRN